MEANRFDTDVIATLAQKYQVGQFTNRFRKMDFGLMPVFICDTQSAVRPSRSLYNCLSVATGWQIVDNLLAGKSQAWLSGPISDAESEKLKEIHARACTLLDEMRCELLENPEHPCTE